jgi:heme oxygenase
MAAHDLLDGSMRAAAGWSAREDYARFLALQYAARVPVEAWLAAHAPNDLHPPPQCAHIAADLASLGETLPRSGPDFALSVPARDDSQTSALALGVCWVLAGSSLGNRAIHGEVKRTARASGEAEWSARFLGDPAMLAFWKDLRQQIERPASTVELDAASRAAAAVFDHFIAIAAPVLDRSLPE